MSDIDTTLTKAAELAVDLHNIYGDQVICSNAADVLIDLAVAMREQQEMLYLAWGVIANAPNGAWDEDSEWRQAAIRWRDDWHKTLGDKHVSRDT